jgi:hypothetical protein
MELDLQSLFGSILIKKKTKFSSYIRKFRSVAKSYMRKGFLIYEEMRKYLTMLYEEADSQICNRTLLNFLIFEESLIFFFISAWVQLYSLTETP